MRHVFAAAILIAAQAAAAPAATLAPAQASPVPQPRKGDKVAAFTTQTIAGAAQEIKFESTTVLLFFTSGCPVCHRMIPEWNRAYERRPQGLRVIGVLVDREPPGFFETMPIAFPVVRAPGREMLDQFNVKRVPTTVRIAAGGVVEDAAVGQIDPIRLGEIFRK